MNSINITIIGASITGLSTAIALKQKGFNVTVYERHVSEQTIGAGVVLWSNASYILDKLGLLHAIEEVASKPKKMQRYSNTGEPLGTLNIEHINKEIGFKSYSILRETFQKILIDRLDGLGVEIHYGYKAIDILCDADETSVVFENGEIIRAHIVVGADGRMNSTVRRYILGENRPVYQSFINWIGIYESKEKMFSTMDILDYWGVGERFGIVPIDAYRCYWAGGMFSAEIATKNPSAYKEELMRLFQDYPPIVSKIINGTTLKSINKIYLHDHEPNSRWHKDNVIMLGDAAHAALPTSGQGSAQALEDAWHFVNILFEHFKHSSNIELAYQEFTQLRYKKTKDICHAGRGLAKRIFNTDAHYCQGRNEESKKANFDELAMGMAKVWRRGLFMYYS